MAPPRRWRGAEPPWPQASAPTAPAIVLQPQPRRVRPPWHAKARVAEIPWFQAAASTNQPVLVAAPAARRRFAWLRRRSAVPPVAGPAEPPVQPVRLRARFLVLRRALAFRAPASPGELVPQQRARLRPPAPRRLRVGAFPWPQVAAAVNPAMVDLGRAPRRRIYGRQRAGRIFEPPWPQATAAPNPAIADLGRRAQRRWAWVRRGHVFEPPWGQAAANTNQPTLVFTWRRPRSTAWLRRARSTAPIHAQQPPIQALAPRRRTPVPRRQRPAPLPLAQVILTPPPWLPQTARRAWVRIWMAPRRSRAGFVYLVVVTGPGPGSVLVLLVDAVPALTSVAEAFPALAMVADAFPARVLITDIYGDAVANYVGKALRIANWGGTTASPIGGFRNSSGALYDPTTPSLKYRLPGQATVTVSGSSLTHDGTGLFSYIVTPAQDGDMVATYISNDGAYADPVAVKIEPAPL